MVLKEIHHFSMACVFLISGGLLMLMRLFYKSDYCLYNKSVLIIKPSSEPSAMNSNKLANKVILFISIVLMTLGLIPWYMHKVVPTYRNYFLFHDPHESLTSIFIKYDKRMILVESCNFIYYFIIFMIAVGFLAFGFHKPQNILPADFTYYRVDHGNHTMCVLGFGVFMWIQPLLIFILVSSFIMALISFGRILVNYRRLVKDKILALRREESSIDMVELQMIHENRESESES